MPRVAVLIRVHNAERYLSLAIDSIRRQTFADFELLLIDNGSRDNSLAVAQAAATEDSRISVIPGHPEGLVQGLNCAVHSARGEFIAILDSDDIAASDRIQRQVLFLDDHADCCAVGSQAMRIDPEGLPIN